jgi:hypothetical protein
LIDPEAITSIVTAVGAVGSSGIGVYFDRIRKRREREEPSLVENAAVEAVAGAVAERPVSVAQVPGHPGAALATQEEAIAQAVSVAVRAELATYQKKSDRTAFKSGMGFFIAGILATIAITLYVHPGH